MCAGVQLTDPPLILVPLTHLAFFANLVWSPLLTMNPVYFHPAPPPPSPPSSSKIRVSCVHPQLRKPPSSWMQPSLHAAPTDRMQTRKIGATPTCCSRCTFTSTAWRKAAREEVSNYITSCHFSFVADLRLDATHWQRFTRGDKHLHSTTVYISTE